MRCLSCDKNLTAFEATRKYKATMQYIDLCNYCFKSIGDPIPVDTRNDLAEYQDDTDEDQDTDEE